MLRGFVPGIAERPFRDAGDACLHRQERHRGNLQAVVIRIVELLLQQAPHAFRDAAILSPGDDKRFFAFGAFAEQRNTLVRLGLIVLGDQLDFHFLAVDLDPAFGIDLFDRNHLAQIVWLAKRRSDAA